MFTIDSFINVPLYVAAGISAVLFIFLLLIKLRNKAKISLVFFISTGIVLIGTIYSTFKGFYSYVVFTIILAEVVLLPYLIVKAFVNPQKIEEKKAAKKAAEISVEADRGILFRTDQKVEKVIWRSNRPLYDLWGSLSAQYDLRGSLSAAVDKLPRRSLFTFTIPAF